MSKVTLVDYGAGNLLNVARAFEHCSAQVEITDNAAAIARAERLVLPGVGAFGHCMQSLHTLGVAAAIIDYVKQDRPFLGICVGMQVMFGMGEEFGRHAGLGIIAGRVETIAPTPVRKVPHVGWATLENVSDQADRFLPPSKASVYFAHSYHAIAARPEDVVAQVEYGGMQICAAVARGNALGVQFHPEKSGEAGLNILRHFFKR